jgi:predicted regulator of amino acid metabolism with ACT domain
MSMKSVVQNIANEIEYLSALARMLESDRQAHKATIEAIDTLQRLLRVIDRQPNRLSEPIPIAA